MTNIEYRIDDIYNRLDEFQNAEKGWDGEDAIPALPITIIHIKLFLMLLPDDIELPGVSMGWDGSISVAWRDDPRIIVDFEGELNYASILIKSKTSKTELKWYVNSPINRELLTALKTYYRVA